MHSSNLEKKLTNRSEAGALFKSPDCAPPTSHHRNIELSIYPYTAAHQSVAASANRDCAISERSSAHPSALEAPRRAPLYTADQRMRRDATIWTPVQGLLAPIQFVIFLISVTLVVRYLATGEGYWLATTSVVVKTFALYAIMITGSIWEREVFGCYLFAPAFYWEDVFSFLVLGLHTAYLAAVLLDVGDQRQQMILALAAYVTYVVNAAQFILKLRMARLDERHASSTSPIAGSHA